MSILQLVVETAFWGTVALLAYIYVGYGLTVFVAAALRRRPVGKAPCTPAVSIIIAAHNEERHIARTIEDKLSLEYPREKLQVIVVSDGSTDRTDAIARSYESRGVLVLRQDPRNGKTAALNVAVEHASGEILVFADANSLYDRGALSSLVRSFADRRVGYVTGRLMYGNPGGSLTGTGCSLYMRYENFVRRCESAVGSVVGVNGGIDAIRRSLYEPMSPDDLPDFALPLRVVAGGHRVVYEPDAVLLEQAHGNARDEYRMRVRVALRSLWTLYDMRFLMNVRRHGLYAVQLLSHKAMRYLGFAFLAALLATSLLLWNESRVYRSAVCLQLAGLVCAAAGFVAERQRHLGPVLSAPYYLFLVNAAAFEAVIRFLRSERIRTWPPRLG